jgi:hypothetical protein
MTQKDKTLRIVVGIFLILIGLPGIGFVNGMMPMMMSGYGMMGYSAGIGNITGIAALIAGIWLIIDAVRK